MRLGRAATGGVILMIAVANTGFFGLPLIAASGGEFSLTVAVMYDAIGTGILIWTFNPIVAAWFGRGEVEDAMTIRQSLKGLLQWVASVVWKLERSDMDISAALSAHQFENGC